MFEKFIKHREYQQLRKDQMTKEKMRNAMTILPILFVLLIAMAAVDKMMPTKPAEATKTVETTAAKPVISQEAKDIERFAYVVTAPIDSLTPEDLDLVNAKAKDPCYEKNASLPREQMIEAIVTCKGLK